MLIDVRKDAGAVQSALLLDNQTAILAETGCAGTIFRARSSLAILAAGNGLEM